MPLVLLRFNERCREVVQPLAEQLPKFVASALDAGAEDLKAALIPTDVEVWCFEGHPFDANTRELEIIILAHEFAPRAADLEERTEQIARRIRRLLKEYGKEHQATLKVLPWGFVWTFLATSAFREL